VEKIIFIIMGVILGIELNGKISGRNKRLKRK
jgi:hypothetical protein